MSRLGLLLAAGIGACPPPAGPPSDACGLRGDTTFASVDEHECGLSPNGVSLCHWSIRFASDGTFTWQYSDVGESGTWSCTEASPSAERGGGSPIDVRFDSASGVLTWEGVAYTERAAD